MKSMGILLTGLLICSGCVKKISGNMTVHEDLYLKKGRKKVLVSEGKHKATFGIRNKRRLDLKISGEKFKFKIPKSDFLSQNHGNFELLPSQTKQPYGIKGQIQKNSKRTEPVDSTESCTISKTRNVCRGYITKQVCTTVRTPARRPHHRPGHRPHHRPQPRPVGSSTRVCKQKSVPNCYYKTFYYNGFRNVTYHYTNSNTSYDVQLTDRDGNTVATFEGSSYGSNKVYDYRDINCRRL